MALATKQTKVGAEVPPVSKDITFEKMRLYSGWPEQKNIHTDYEAAKRAKLPGPIAQGLMSAAYISEMLTKFFGEGWMKGGKLSVSFINIVQPGDKVTAKGVVKERVTEDSKVRLVLDVWCENQNGVKVTVGTASGLVS